MTTVEASQETIWFTLINTVHQAFLFYRLISEIEIKKIKSIKSGTLFPQGEPRSLIDHILSRLWWLDIIQRMIVA
ncbi:DUF6339 family protein, partial [Listeria monocytogenes]|uniref:DUF6339 family protein n=1 Tax=Listeria monocytogenes TaxID=1639 RepID=UPI001CF2A3F6